MYLKIILIREKLFHGNRENWDQSAPSNSPKAPGTKGKFGKERVQSQGIIQKCEPHERSPCAPKFGERSHEETLHQERCARRVAWDLAENIYKFKNADKATFYSSIEATAQEFGHSFVFIFLMSGKTKK